MSRIERCRLCGERFSTTTAGDMHRAISGTYNLIRRKGSTVVERIASGEPVPTGARVLSRGNQIRRCRGVVELIYLGMRQTVRGVWTAGTASGSRPPWDGSAQPPVSTSGGLAGRPGTRVRVEPVIASDLSLAVSA